jgi:dihydroceramidase
MVWGIWLRHCLNERQEDYELSWPSLFSLPDIVPSRENQTYEKREKSVNGVSNGKTNGNGLSNGHAKKTI